MKNFFFKRAKRLASGLILAFWDVLTVTVSIYIALKLRFPSMPDPPISYTEHMLIYIPLAAGIMVLFNMIFGCYASIWKYIDMVDVLRQIASVICGMTLFYFLNVWLSLNVRLEIVIQMGFLILMFSLIGRASVRVVSAANEQLSNSMRKKNAKRCVIFGAGEAGRFLYKKLSVDVSEDLRPVCFIDDNPSIHGKKIGTVKVYGGLDQMEEAIHKFDAQVVVVAIPTATREVLQQVLDICRRGKCSMRTFGNISDISLQNATVREINLEELLRRDSVHLNMEAVQEFIGGKTVLVTGGAGSIGSEICRQVLSFGCGKLIIFDIHENGMFELDNELRERYEGRYELKIGSIRDSRRLHELFRKHRPSIVFHAAAHKHVPMMELSPCEAIKNNVFGTVNVAAAAARYGTEKFILISTDKAVNPTNIMGASKRIAELCIQQMNGQSKTDFAAVRFGNVLGSNGSVVPFFQKQIERGGPVTVTHRDMRRYFMTIPEAVQLVLEAGAMAHGGEIFVLDMGEPVRIYDLALDLIRLSGYEPFVDIPVIFTGVRPGEKLFEEIRLDDEDVIKTDNQKILVLKPSETRQNTLSEILELLSKPLEEESCGTLFDAVRQLVPAFDRNGDGAE